MNITLRSPWWFTGRMWRNGGGRHWLTPWLFGVHAQRRRRSNTIFSIYTSPGSWWWDCLSVKIASTPQPPPSTYYPKSTASVPYSLDIVDIHLKWQNICSIFGAKLRTAIIGRKRLFSLGAGSEPAWERARNWDQCGDGWFSHSDIA